MDTHGRVLRLGAGMILLALILRLSAAGVLDPALDLLNDQRLYSFLLYLETGRIVRFSPSLEENEKFAGESAAPFALTPALPAFTREDSIGVKLKNSAGAQLDVEALMQQPLKWDLTGQGPTVLILHTHATESYTKDGEDYRESAAYRTLDEGYNMISVGDRVAAMLEAAGIGVIHDRTLHDYPSYNGSYTHARKSIAQYLEEYPTICMVLDLHRDASGDPDRQLRTAAQVEGRTCAQLMLVMGTNAGGQSHPNWTDNLALGLKLQVQLERQAPGITRPIYLRSQRFNQDMTSGSLLIEVGAAGNTHAEALLAAEYLARAIIALSKGTQ